MDMSLFSWCVSFLKTECCVTFSIEKSQNESFFVCLFQFPDPSLFQNWFSQVLIISSVAFYINTKRLFLLLRITAMIYFMTVYNSCT